MSPRGHEANEILISALVPWTSIAEPRLEAGDRFTVTRDVFQVGGFRLTFVRTKDPGAPESIGRIEYVFRERSLRDASQRLDESFQRFGLDVTPKLDDVIARASKIPDDLAGLGIGQRLEAQSLDWAGGWRGSVKLYAECAQTGNDMRRTNWMVELRVFQPAFRTPSDP